MSPTLRSAAGSDVGRRRPMNQDSAVVTSRLLAVADGMGGHAHGEVASTVAVSALVDLDRRLPADLSQVNLVEALKEAVLDAADRLTDAAKSDSELRGTGTTVVAFLVDQGRIGIAHVGDSRGYLLRGGELFRLTRDHTLVQALLDEGRITPEEAVGHPRRSWLVRTLQEATPVEPDLFAVDGQVGDRYLICSDGVTAVLDDEALREVLDTVEDPAMVVTRLIELANDGGGPDNITCIVADLVDGEPEEAQPALFGAAAAARD
jgi:PPM family protein phosphatase